MILDVETLREYFTILNVDSKRKNARGVCPECGGGEFYISLIREGNPFRCWRSNKCGFAGNSISYLKKIGKLGLFLDAGKGYKEYLTLIELEPEIVVDDILIEEETKLPLGFKRTFDHEYLNNRGFDESHYHRYPVGITKIEPSYRSRLIFPIMSNDKINAYVGRAINDTITPKYKNSTTSVSNTLYGLNDYLKQDVGIIVEGIFDKKNIDDYLEYVGLDQDIICFSTLGSSLSDNQVKILNNRGIRNIVIMYDKDVVHLTRKNSEYFLFFDEIFCTFVDSKDPGVATFDQIEKALNNVQSINQFSFNTVRQFSL